VSELEERKPLRECYNEQYGDDNEEGEFECEECGYSSDDVSKFADDSYVTLCNHCYNVDTTDKDVTNEELSLEMPNSLMDEDDVTETEKAKAFYKGYKAAMNKFHSKRDCKGRFCK
jgi:hypothetical protein